MAKKRIDSLLTERGYFSSRSQAQQAVRAGWVWVDDQRATKPGRLYGEDSRIRVKEKPRYVGRGGYKLKGALEAFKLEVRNKVVLDVGSSTGGFTDCLLQEGARRVYCLDVGKGQLAWELRQDHRVVVKEGFNARYLREEDLPEKMDLITVDVSFISLTKVLPALAAVVKSGGQILALIKPQFEAPREKVKKGGVVKDPNVHQAVMEKIKNFVSRMGMKPGGLAQSVLTGPAGNKEFFILIRK